MSPAEPDGEIPFVYANAVQLAMGPFDLTMDFGFKRPEDARPGWNDYQKLVRITMSPSHAKSLLRLLVDHVAAYENQFGVIPSPHYKEGESG